MAKDREDAAGGEDFDPDESPIVWFAILDRALEVGDLPRAVEAQEELRRLGVEVRVLCRPRGTKRGAA